jgi:hypothetical protein
VGGGEELRQGVSSTEQQPNALRRFVDTGTRPWSGEPVALTTRVTVALWSTFFASLAFAVWLVLVLTGSMPCGGWTCAVVTWNEPPVVLGLAAASAVGLGWCACLTRGLSRAGAVPLALAVTSAVVGLVALAGLVLLVAGAVTVLVAAAAFLIAVIDRV